MIDSVFYYFKLVPMLFFLVTLLIPSYRAHLWLGSVAALLYHLGTLADQLTLRPLSQLWNSSAFCPMLLHITCYAVSIFLCARLAPRAAAQTRDQGQRIAGTSAAGAPAGAPDSGTPARAGSLALYLLCFLPAVLATAAVFADWAPLFSMLDGLGVSESSSFILLMLPEFLIPLALVFIGLFLTGGVQRSGTPG